MLTYGAFEAWRCFFSMNHNAALEVKRDKKKKTIEQRKGKNSHCCNCDAVYFFMVFDIFMLLAKIEMCCNEWKMKIKKRNCVPMCKQEEI